MKRDVRLGVWMDIPDADKFALYLKGEHFPARVQKGEFEGPGKYMIFSYHQRCPRNCCEDLVREIVPAATVRDEIVSEIRRLANILKESRS